jgi:HSP20 family protein
MAAWKNDSDVTQVALHEIEHMSVSRTSTTRWILIGRSHLWRPPTDMYETEDKFVIQVEIAGMSSADFSIMIHDQRVTISGERRDTGGARAYHQMEIHYGEFRTDVEVPTRFDRESVQAAYDDGYLKLVLPKLKTHRIDVKDVP